MVVVDTVVAAVVVMAVDGFYPTYQLYICFVHDAYNYCHWFNQHFMSSFNY